LKLLIVTASDELGALGCDDVPVDDGDAAVALPSLPPPHPASRPPTAAAASSVGPMWLGFMHRT